MYNDADSHSPWADHDSATPAPGHGACATSDSRSPGTTDEAAAGYATYELRRILAAIEQARDEQALFWISSTAFGPNSFCSRFGEALGQTPRHLPLIKLMIQAELEDRLTGRTPWPTPTNRSLGFGGPELWEVGSHLHHTRLSLLRDQVPLKKSAESRALLLAELTTLFSSNDTACIRLREKLEPQARAHWLRYLEKINSPKHHSDAGWSFGMVLLQVLSALRMLDSHHADVFGTFPALARYAGAPSQ